MNTASLSGRRLHSRLITLAVSLAGLAILPVLAANDPPTIVGNSIFFQGNQSGGISWSIGSLSDPSSLFAINLNTSIVPPSGTTGIFMTGSDQTRNFSITTDGSQDIFTGGNYAYGIHVENTGGFAGTFEIVTNYSVLVTNVVGTNVTVYTTNFNYGSSGTFGGTFTTNTTLAPAGGVAVTNKSFIETDGYGAHGIFADVPYGTIHFDGPFGNLTFPFGTGGPVHVENSAGILTFGDNSSGIAAESHGGFDSSALNAEIHSTGDITTFGTYSHGLFALSEGGNGHGGSSGAFGGSSGGPGGNGGFASVTGSGSIYTGEDNSDGVAAISHAGNGGGGGSAVVGGSGGSGGTAGAGGPVMINGNWSIQTWGSNSIGVFGMSGGGNGGTGGGGGFFAGSGGGGGSTGDGGNVSVTTAGSIETHGAESHGVMAESVGGFAGNGGSTSIGIFYAAGGNGGSAGNGGSVALTNSAVVTTYGEGSHNIFAESIGGGGGSAGSGHGIYAVGGDGNAGGAGGTVIVNNSGNLTNYGINSRGIFAQSVGGGGGDGGDAGGIGSVGGSGSSTSYGGAVTVLNSGSIYSQAHAIFAQSIGGGGGNGGSSAGWFSVGGDGGGGGNGLAVTVNNSGSLQTFNRNSSAIFAQSVGGGGGNGGNSASVGAIASVAIGGSGGNGGSGDIVTVNNTGGNFITTSGAGSHGVFAQSVGGGGGNGGFAFSGAISPGPAISIGIGGNGAGGGNGEKVFVSNNSAITTYGTNAHGIFAQSVGGSGGSGGFAISVSGGSTFNGAFAMGGSGATGGVARAVMVYNQGDISTWAEHSYGLLAQSVGGGGGDGGFSIAGSFSVGGVAGALSIGGSGGLGGAGDSVGVTNTGTIFTDGNNSHGVFAQSIGGGGGSGGFSVAGSMTADGVSASVSLGGSGSAGGNAGSVTLASTGTNITTVGSHSFGIVAQSIGGGGGDGGFSVAGSISGAGPAAGFSLGGSGSSGGSAGQVSLTSASSILTYGDNSHGIFAESLGGGGGSGGFSVSGNIAMSGAAVGASIGGSGGGGVNADAVNVTSTGVSIETLGNHSYGVLAESIGGGGGDGGFAVAGGISGSASVNLGIGGSGATAGSAGAVTLNNSSTILTHGEDAHGLFAESLGGGGGSGGFSIAGGISGSSGSFNASIGGSAGGGGSASSVTLLNTAALIMTSSNRSDGILAESIGGGGGNGGFAIAGGISGDGPTANFSLGGGGGTGGNSGNVRVENASSVYTSGTNANGIIAQSVGGGGGNGGFAISGGISAQSAAVDASIGGSGGVAGNAGGVMLTSTGTNIMTGGDHSYGLLAQSLGGGGGDGGFAVAGGISDSASVNLGLGGKAGAAGNADAVALTNSGVVTTFGDDSHAVFAQSVGGGGGNGGFSVAGGISGNSGSLNASIGGGGGAGGSGSNVTLINTSTGITTWGNRSDGLVAQSVGGGGGNGGFSIAGGISKSASVNFSMGGSGGTASDAGAVLLEGSSIISTHGDDSHGILAQSVGGSGGNGGWSIAGGISADSPAVSASIGGNGGGGGNGRGVTLASTGDAITTAGGRSYGILAQSIGGSGGDGGFSIAGDISKSTTVSFSMGGQGGIAGNAGDVLVSNFSSIGTLGSNSHALFVQSVGGGGGAGGFSVSGNFSKEGVAVGASLGGKGGGGGNAGAVTLTSTSSNLFTAGDHAYGILAQSVGGGGGDGGFSIDGALSKGAQANFSLGGDGNTGGTAGAVVVNNSSDILTYGQISHGLFAQSVGGGGGDGGFSIAGGLSKEKGNFSLAIGGAGSNGVDANTVFVSNTGTIITTNIGSHAIVAQSIGGGGGDGGFAGSLAGGFGDGAKVAVTIGGAGGNAGRGKDVAVTSTGQQIETMADASFGLFAQSVGGGGGDGGFALALALGKGTNSTDVAISVGGFGGDGASGGTVEVTNFSVITTYGTNSHGIFAQSVGGGGGDGGFSAAGTLGISTNSKQVSLSLGGFGGTGNTASGVTVDNHAQIFTHGDNSIGILAQSIGGGGGNGGMSFAGDLAGGGAKDLSATIGGFGGTGGDAGNVSVTTVSNIYTLGANSHGILAQSVGGGGGNGGLSAAMDFTLGSKTKNYQFSLSLGGYGGAGGNGSNVFVGGSGEILTRGESAYGVFAQSVGGGGGAGGFSLAGSAVLFAAQGTNRSLDLAVGGAGGAAGDAGSVTINRSGEIVTIGDGSYGLMAQSVGGGGGDGGGARALSLFTSGGGAAKTNTSSKALDVSIGGAGGSAGNGGSVAVTNSGDIFTEGADAYGIFAQSIGGGGGDGGAAHKGFGDLIPVTGGELIPKAVSTKNSTFNVVVGGGGGSSGQGDHVSVDQTGNITTLADGSFGIMAQSVGGGGGIGGTGAEGATGKIGIGGAGGSAGDGGEVDVAFHGNLNTFGEGSTAIFAQSVGGGGGVAGNVDRGLKGKGLNIGIGFAYGQDGGSAGNGGVVTVNSTGHIHTFGDGASGIFAQSVGGGGGLTGDIGTDPFSFLGIAHFAGSVGGSGSGGDVNISHDGDITTFGTNSHGIFAQSAGGTNGVGGNITVSLAGAIYANGVDSDGIFAQSGGGATVVTPPIPTAPLSLRNGAITPGITPVNGDVTVTVASNSVVQGGTGDSAGVRFLDGVNNTLQNRGGITTLNGINGLAISGTGGNETINNYGVVFGSVDLGGGGNTFNNESGAVFDTGNIINMGDGNTLGNAGILSLGGANTIQTAALTGNYLQTSNGMFQVKLASASSYDTLTGSGSAALDGNLSVYRFQNFLPVKGDTFTILTASNGVNGQFASFYDPYLGNYAVHLQTIYESNDVVLQTIQDSFSQFGHTHNQRSVAKNLNSFSGDGGTGGDPRGAPLIAFLNTESGDQLPADFDLIAPEEFGAMFDLNFAAVNASVRHLQQRMSDLRLGNTGVGGSVSMFDPRQQNFIQLASADHSLPVMKSHVPEDTWGIFVAGDAQYVDVDGSTNAAGYHFHSGGVTLGADRRVSDKLAAGVTLDYAGSDASLVHDGDVKVNGGRIGGYATWFGKEHYLEAELGGGYNHYDTERASLGGMAKGSTDGFEFDTLLAGGCNRRSGHWLFGPQAQAQYTMVDINGFTETGSLSPLQVQDNVSQSLQTQLGGHIAYEWKLNGILVRPSVQIGWQHEFLDQNRAIDSRLASGAGSVFRVNSPSIGRDSAALDAGVGVQWSRTVYSYLSYHGDLGRASYIAHTINAGVSLSF